MSAFLLVINIYMIIMAPISVGELIDKITILSIKLHRITDTTKKNNVLNEFKQLNAIAETLNPKVGLKTYYQQLYQINNELFDIENNKREHERLKKFNQDFIELARKVYMLNDERARIKKEINILMGSSIIEEKQHTNN